MIPQLKELEGNLREILEEAQYGDLDRDVLITAAKAALNALEQLKPLIEKGVAFAQESYIEH